MNVSWLARRGGRHGARRSLRGGDAVVLDDHLVHAAGGLLRHHHRDIAPVAGRASRAGISLSCTTWPRSSPLASFIDPLDLHPLLVRPRSASAHSPATMKSAPVGGVLHARSPSVVSCARICRVSDGVAVAGRAGHGLDHAPRRAVEQAVRVALLPRRLDAGEQGGDPRGGVGGGLGQRGRRRRPPRRRPAPAGPRRLPLRSPAGSSRVNMRHHRCPRRSRRVTTRRQSPVCAGARRRPAPPAACRPWRRRRR